MAARLGLRLLRRETAAYTCEKIEGKYSMPSEKQFEALGLDGKGPLVNIE